MNEKVQVVRTTPYGVQLEDGSYRNTSEAVRKFLQGKLPAELEITEKQTKNGKESITKVNILPRKAGTSQLKTKPGATDSQDRIQAMSLLKTKVNVWCSALDNATKLVLANEEMEKTTPVVMKVMYELMNTAPLKMSWDTEKAYKEAGAEKDGSQ